METNTDSPEAINELQSLQMITEMIQVSKNKIQKDGILFIIWGWLMFYVASLEFIKRNFLLRSDTHNLLNYLLVVLVIATLGFIVYYLLKQWKKVQTYIGISLRYVWISLFISMIFINLIQASVLHNIDFELQHPIFMVLMAFAVTVT